MPRPKKWRRVCCMPGNQNFGPLDRAGAEREAVVMAIDEFESIRLIDLEGLSQEQCAERMGVARTTAQAIYNSARLKLAEALVNGRDLSIGGGEYILCGGEDPGLGCGRCPRGRFMPAQEITEMNTKGTKIDMRIAVTYENGQVFQHFGHTERFKIYDIENDRVVLATTVNTNGSGHGALADILKKLSVDALICGGIGAGAKRALSEAEIALYPGVTGDADKAVDSLIAGSLVYDTETQCSHHGEHHDGECGEHGCGEHDR